MKHCPICNAKYESGKFCLDCGEPLVDDAPAAGMSLNLGDDNAISGGVQMSDSHNVSNVDQRVINTSTVSNVTNNITQVERQKTEQEMAQERKIQFMELCKEVYADGILEDWEAAKLETRRIELGIETNLAAQLIELARKSMPNRMTALTKKDEVTMKIILGLVEKNQTDRIEAQLPRLQAMAKYYQVDEVLYTYNMIMAALHPEDLVKKFEDEPTDEYWQTFWASIAYLKIGKVDKSEETSAKLNFFGNYSEDNDMLLSLMSINHDFGAETAKEGLSILDESSCSPELRPLFLTLCLAIDPSRATTLGADKSKCQFYMDYIVTLEDPKARAERLAREQAEAERKKKEQEEKLRQQITYCVSIKKIDNQLLASMTARTSLGWTTEVSRTNFAHLPFKAKSSDNRDEIETLADKLSKGGMTVEVTAVNGLNETVSIIEEPSSFDVELKSAGKAKLGVVKLVKDITRFDLKETKDLVDTVPQVIKKGVSKEEADSIIAQFKEYEEYGAKVEIVPANGLNEVVSKTASSKWKEAEAAEKKRKEEERKRKEAEKEAERKRIEAEKKRKEQEELAKKKAEEAKREVEAAKTAYMNIQKVEFAYMDFDGNYTSAYGANLKHDETRRQLKARITYDGLLEHDRTINLHVKIINPSGKLISPVRFKVEYTGMNSITVKKGTNQKVELMGTGGVYDYGTYQYELWYNDVLVYKTSFSVR